MSRFTTLLHREWMQHHRGWLVLILVLPVLFLVVTPFSTVQIDPGDADALRSLQTATGLMLATMVMVPLTVLGLTAAALAFQASGLARRDVQDRSIEFWLSLPVNHAAGVGAPVLAHFVLVPLLAFAVGAASSYLIGAGLVGKLFGFGAVSTLPWGALAVAGLAGLVRGLFGVVLASAWVMPLLLLTMAASAWMKRWGVAVLSLGLLLGHKLLSARYGITVIGDTVDGWLVNAPVALVHAVSTGQPPRLPQPDQLGAWLGEAPAWLLGDGLASLRELGQPLFLEAAVVCAVCFGLLVLRRSRTR